MSGKNHFFNRRIKIFNILNKIVDAILPKKKDFYDHLLSEHKGVLAVKKLLEDGLSYDEIYRRLGLNSWRRKTDFDKGALSYIRYRKEISKSVAFNSAILDLKNFKNLDVALFGTLNPKDIKAPDTPPFQSIEAYEESLILYKLLKIRLIGAIKSLKRYHHYTPLGYQADGEFCQGRYIKVSDLLELIDKF